MFFPLILAAVLIVTAVFLVRQFWHGSLAEDDGAPPELLSSRREEDPRDALKAA